MLLLDMASLILFVKISISCYFYFSSICNRALLFNKVRLFFYSYALRVLKDYSSSISSLILVCFYYNYFRSVKSFLSFSCKYSMNILIYCSVLIWFLIVAYSLWHCYYRFLQTFSCMKFFLIAFTKKSTRPTLISAKDNERS